eukprot:403368969
MSIKWQEILKLVKTQNFDQAYDVCLSELDDIYLLRLLAQTGPIVGKFQDQNIASQVLQRINKINRSGAFQAINIDLIEDFLIDSNQKYSQMTNQDINEQADCLYQIMKNKALNDKIRRRAQKVYEQIIQQTRSYKNL